MKALSFSQPWLWACFHPDPSKRKDIENRFWQIPIEMIGVPISAHSAKSFDDDGLNALWELGIETPQTYVKSAIVGVMTFDRVVTTPKTLTPEQRVWYMGDDEGYRENEIGQRKQVYGHVIGERNLLPHPIPWDGSLGLWTVPPLVEHAIHVQFREEDDVFDGAMKRCLESAAITDRSEWPARHPAEHLWFDYRGVTSCACCGHFKVKPDAKKPQKPCKGVLKIGAA